MNMRRFLLTISRMYKLNCCSQQIRSRKFSERKKKLAEHQRRATIKDDRLEAREDPNGFAAATYTRSAFGYGIL